MLPSSWISAESSFISFSGSVFGMPLISLSARISSSSSPSPISSVSSLIWFSVFFHYFIRITKVFHVYVCCTWFAVVEVFKDVLKSFAANGTYYSTRCFIKVDNFRSVHQFVRKFGSLLCLWLLNLDLIKILITKNISV